MNEIGETGGYLNSEMSVFPNNVKNDCHGNNEYWNSETGEYQNNEKNDFGNYVSSEYQNNEKNEHLNL